MKTILLVDDDEDITELVQLVLSKSGYKMVVARSGGEALGICREGLPDLVLMDIRMPDMDGFSAIRTLREEGFNNPIIVLTGSESAEDRERAMAAGCDDYILMTMEMRDLEASIDGFLQKGGGL